jgi:protein gp37
MDHRYGRVKWGPQGTRIRTAKGYWKLPLKWNQAVWVNCDVCGLRQVFDRDGTCPACHHPLIRVTSRTRQRVFCGSLCDVFEDRPEIGDWRLELFDLIESTPNLDWLLLTKRPENVRAMVPWERYPENVWIGTSVEDQKAADKRIPELLQIPARVRFLSCEPLLGPVDLSDYLGFIEGDYKKPLIGWVICGGESGPHARPMDPAWVRTLSKLCLHAEVPFFFKQWGEWLPLSHFYYAGLKDDLTFTKKPVPFGSEMMCFVGKKRAGRFLDGHEEDEFPILNRVRILASDPLPASPRWDPSTSEEK